MLFKPQLQQRRNIRWRGHLLCRSARRLWADPQTPDRPMRPSPRHPPSRISSPPRQGQGRGSDSPYLPPPISEEGREGVGQPPAGWRQFAARQA